MFDINNSRDFYAKLLADFDDFMESADSARHAMNCAITAHHVHDWVWSDYLKNDVVTANSWASESKKRSSSGGLMGTPSGLAWSRRFRTAVSILDAKRRSKPGAWLDMAWAVTALEASVNPI
jgi:hypothetical protein